MRLLAYALWLVLVSLSSFLEPISGLSLTSGSSDISSRRPYYYYLTNQRDGVRRAMASTRDESLTTANGARQSDDIVFEMYKPVHEDQIRRLFQDGIMSLVNDAYRHVLFRSKLGWATLGLSGAVMSVLGRYRSGSGIAPTVLSAGLVPCTALYVRLWYIFRRYTVGALQDDLANIDRVYSSNDGIFLVARCRSTDEIVGMVGGERKKADTIELRRMSVKQTFQGRRIGSRLIQALVDFGQKEKCNRLFLTCTSVQYAAHALYNKNGFELKGTFPAFMGNSILVYLLEKKLY